MLLPGEAADNVLALLLDNAKNYILGYTCRTESQWLSFFDAIQLRIAVIDYNRMGAEGVASRSEGGISTGFLGASDYPDSIVKQLNPHRLIKGWPPSSANTGPCSGSVSSP